MTALTPRRALVGLVALLMLVLSACGGGTTTVVSSPRSTPLDGAAAEGDAGETEAPAEDSAEPGDGAAADDMADGEAPAPDGEGDDEDEPTFKLGPLDIGDPDDKAAADLPDDNAAGGVPVGASFLTQAADATTAAESYRYEMNFSMFIADGTTVIDMSPDAPVSTGEVVGTSSRMFTDLGPLFDDMFDSIGGGDASAMIDLLFGDDLSMEVITTDTTIYLRAPMLAAMASGPAAAEFGSEFAGLADLDTGWGTIDLTALGDELSAGEIAGLTGAQTGSSPEDLLDMLREVSTDVTDLGPATVRGVDTNHFRAIVNLASMLDAQGMDTQELGVDLSSFAVDLPFDVFVDDQGRVRRVTMGMSLDTLAQLVPDEPVPAGMQFEFSTTLDLFDFGEAIEINPPAPSDIVGDFSEAFAALATLGG